MGTHPIFESDFDCLTDVKMSLKDMKSSLFSDLINGIRQQWPMLLSAGLIILELRKLREQLIQINQEINRLSDSNSSIGFRRARNSASGVSTDDWFSVYDSEEDEEEELSEEDQLISRIDKLHYS